MAQFGKAVAVFIAITTMGFAACKKKPEGLSPVELPKKPVERFDRAKFPCKDLIQGVWRVYKYRELGLGRVVFPEKTGVTMHWGIQSDTFRIYQADTLIYYDYYRFYQLSSDAVKPPGYERNPFTHQLISGHQIRDETKYQGYYVRLQADTLFLFGSYDDGPDFWMVRDCK